MGQRILVISLIAVLSVFCLPSQSSGQVPGYLGKRFLFSYDAKLSPNIYRYTNNPDHGNPLINYMHNVDVEYVISQGGALGLSFKYTRNRFDIKNDYRQEVLDGDASIPGIVDYKALAFSYKAFMRSKGVMAPLGHYFKTEIAFGRMNYRPENDERWNVSEFEGGFWVPSLNIALGKHFIVWDMMLIDMAMELTTPYNFSGVIFNTTPILDLNSRKNADQAHKRMYRQLFFNFRIGVGFVGF